MVEFLVIFEGESGTKIKKKLFVKTNPSQKEFFRDFSTFFDFEKCQDLTESRKLKNNLSSGFWHPGQTKKFQLNVLDFALPSLATGPKQSVKPISHDLR